MAAARRVGVGQFVHQHHLRPANENGIEVHLVERLAHTLRCDAELISSPSSSASVSLPAVGFDHADDDVIDVLHLARAVSSIS